MQRGYLLPTGGLCADVYICVPFSTGHSPAAPR